VPGGSDYPGPKETLEKYQAAVDAAGNGIEVKGAKNPYTSRNGHMFSFLDPDGTMALRLSDELAEEFAADHETGPVRHYGSVMRGYLSVPALLLADDAAAGAWIARSHHWIGTLPPKSTKRES